MTAPAAPRIDTQAILARRDAFPRGMIQPEEGYRFSLDSLLLACFARPGREQVGIDLGCGCGVVGLALLLRQPDLRLTGVDIDPESVRVAGLNAVNLHYADRYAATLADVAQWRSERVVDFVVANPPYRPLGCGRVSQGESRAVARFESRGDFALFAQCAAVALRTRGRFTFVHLPERLSEIMDGLSKAGLAPKRLRLVYGRSDQEARMALVEAVKAGKPGLRVEPPLILHSGSGRQTRLTDEAIGFCAFLCSQGEPDTHHTPSEDSHA
ncbi:MAG: methyltransferase [Pseudodesulfovibrio sp.]|uniref:Methyltransferase small n=1 Tax=Pseudodesulfovibrio aespoeensis (strain ATCC 700646 / DSM 10631 / Aspo-2) TaxID=643562 RepID=E6VUL4_PSEA9|nr:MULTISPECIES: methyltransferase [Pseudodesulfovibrio]MBU4191097.1 methyltransferase [Pseudomonadota bacterium]ADU61159.1 methyltransferase small [Pseudodesulfovibrio aespoeensis Aspo-2]MBU4243657.1 methyltransferase [Pseudomonadota bacterium]MBU4379166.1 methyltransferase [Pseudomonadota bacterium]MBU4475029.1 methyltransferase [Pseudomonadota bacterium]